MKNSECKVRPEIISINSNNPMFYPFSIKVNKYNSNCNDINNPYAKILVPDIVKNLNVKIFNLMSRTNETRSIKWHKKCKCICRLNGIICNNKQRWNKDKCRCDCIKLIDKRVFDKGFIWNPSNYKCECDKSCNIGQYLDYSDCKCKKKLTNELTDECNETIEQAKLVNITFTENENNYECASCIVYIVLMIVAFTIFTAITVYLIYYNWYLINNNNNNNNDNDNDDYNDDNYNKNKNLMNVIIKNGHSKKNKY